MPSLRTVGAMTGLLLGIAAIVHTLYENDRSARRADDVAREIAALRSRLERVDKRASRNHTETTPATASETQEWRVDARPVAAPTDGEEAEELTEAEEREQSRRREIGRAHV